MKPLDRLKQAYELYKNSNPFSKEARRKEYRAMRLFALDCGLVSFAEIELMEYENK